MWSAQNLKCIYIVCQCKCGLCDLCDRESDDEDSWLLFLLCQSRAIPKKDKFTYPFASLELLPCLKGDRWRMMEAIRTRNSQEDSWRQRGKQLEKVTQDQVYSEENGNQCEVKQEEEFNADRFKVGPSYIDREGARRCAILGLLVGNSCSQKCGKNALGSEMLEQQGVLMVKFKSKCAPIEQDEPFEEHAVAGRMKQNLLFFRNLSSGQKMCAHFGKR